jgi:hypothetical protein
LNIENIVHNYTINRQLTDEELNNQLHVKNKLDVDPLGQLNVIRINSIFIETADKFYRTKGLLTSGMTCIGMLFIFASLFMGFGSIYDAFYRDITNPVGAFCAGLFVVIGSSVMVFICYWLFMQDTFAWTHYPIRLNRNTRMVHAFRIGGSVLSIPWDDVFFTLARAQKLTGIQFWKVSGRVLDKDGITVKDNFSFGYESNVQENVLEFWEFLRRYMEEGPQGLPEKLVYCPPIHDRREPVRFGLWFMWMDLNGQRIGQISMLPFTLFNWLGRMVAMRTCKIPQWPKEIEETCTIEPNDPYVKDWRSNPELTWLS